MTIWRSLHNIDLPNRKIISKDSIPDDFSSFMAEFVQFATNNDAIKYYCVHDPHTQVFNCIAQVVEAYLSSEAEPCAQIFTDCSNSIADKLFRVEAEVQSQIDAMGKSIKRGSLVQALLRDGLNMLYVIAKVEHREWFDGDSLIKNFGFPSDKKNVWKSAVIPISIEDDEIIFGSIRVYTDNPAKYWATLFLEADEEADDAVTTAQVFKEVLNVLQKELKNKSEQDFLLLRNTLIKEMKTEQPINYFEFIDKLIIGYNPEVENLDLEHLHERLRGLPEKKKFSTQFNTVPSAIKSRQRLKFVPMAGIELSINGSIENMRNSIASVKNDRGDKFLRIACTDEGVYNAFQRNQ